MSQQFDFHPYYVLDAISSRFFAVPRYQRSYAWEKEQLNDFWSDMERSISAGGDYFLGSFVLSNEDQADYVSIIDGQQRVVTTTILLASMRDIYAVNGKEKLASSLDEKYLQEHDVIQDKNRRRIKLNTDDDDYYVNHILMNVDVPPAMASHRRLAFAKAFFREKLQRVVDNDPNWLNNFSKISYYLKCQARVVVVTTASDADAFTIFETLNDRGADLTIADLLKNFLFSSSKGELETVQRYWTEAVTTLENSPRDVEFVAFLRQLWSSYRGATRERDLYRDIKSTIKSVQDAVNFARQIRDGANDYRAIISADSEYWSSFDKATRDSIAFIASQNIQQVKPLMLSILSTLPREAVAAIVKNMVSWLVRSVVAGNPGGGQAERYFCDAAVKVRKKEIQSASELIDSLSTVVPNDASFQTAFSSMPVKKSAQARYYLCAIEKYLRKEQDPELILNERAAEMNLEHILPQNPKKDEWKPFDKDQAEAFTHRLGNMTLLRKIDNQKLSNGEWIAKRQTLRTSQLKINEELVKIDNWDVDSINARQTELADHAVKIWPLLS